MEIANVMLALGGDKGNTVPKRGVTAGEIAVLRAIHGDDAVHDVEPAGVIQRTSRAERQRLLQLYPARDNDDNQIVSVLYPGAAARVFETLDELELDETFFKPVSRADTARTTPRAEQLAAAPEVGEPDFEKMTIKELRDYAQANQIDLAGVTKKPEIIAEIENATAPVADNDTDDDGVGDIDQALFQ